MVLYQRRSGPSRRRKPAVQHERQEQIALCEWMDLRGLRYFAVPKIATA